MNTARTIADLCDLCGEGPIWDFRSERLVWTDIPRNVLHELDPVTRSIRSTLISKCASAIALNQSNTRLVCGPEGLFLIEPGRAPHPLLSEPAPFNDMIAGPGGIIYAGTIFWDGSQPRKTGELWLIDPRAGAFPVDDGIELANGLGFSPDNRTLYLADSAARRIYAYDLSPESGRLSGKRVLLSVPSSEGIPDGLAVDAEGFIWSAQWYGSQVVRYDPEGKVERRIRLPVSQVSSLAFGGPDLNQLYITSAAEEWRSHLAPENHRYGMLPNGGPLYCLSLDIQGKLEHVARFSCPEG